MKLLLSPRLSEDSKVLWNEAPKMGWEVERIGWRANGAAADALYGETMWARIIAQEIGMRLVDPPCDWQAGLSHKFVGRNIQYDFLDKVTLGYPMFIKPPDYKTFQAKVYESEPYVDMTERVISSEPIEITHEARFWIRDSLVQAHSFYMADPAHELPDIEAGIDLVHWAIRDNPLTCAAVVDAAWLKKGGWVIIEANPAYCSGVYDANVYGVLRTLERACSPGSATDGTKS